MEDFKDLYGDSIIDVIKLDFDPSFEDIRDYFNTTDQMERTFKSGDRMIKAKRKFTHVGGGGKMFRIKTNYLHIYLLDNKGDVKKHYKETNDGCFKLI